MIYLFVPYYTPPTEGFIHSLKIQTNVNYQVIYYHRTKELWTEACNEFYREMEWRYYHGKVNFFDIIGIMNADISFGKDFLTEANNAGRKQIYIPKLNSVHIGWKHKTFRPVYFKHELNTVDGFYGRAFFMSVKDFLTVGKFDPKLPHYLSDLDFSIRAIKKGMKPVLMKNDIYHEEHEYEKNTFSLFSPLSNRNPIIWTRFLLKHCPKRYLPINLLKTWMEVFK